MRSREKEWGLGLRDWGSMESVGEVKRGMEGVGRLGEGWRVGGGEERDGGSGRRGAGWREWEGGERDGGSGEVGRGEGGGGRYGQQAGQG